MTYLPVSSLFFHHKCISDYLYLVSLYTDNIKSHFPVKRVMTFHIEQRRFYKVLSFPGIDSVERIAKVWRVSLFHLYENKAAFFFGNDIYFAKSGPEVLFNDSISFLFQGFFSSLFSLSTFFLFRRQGILSRL